MGWVILAAVWSVVGACFGIRWMMSNLAEANNAEDGFWFRWLPEWVVVIVGGPLAWIFAAAMWIVLRRDQAREAKRIP